MCCRQPVVGVEGRVMPNPFESALLNLQLFDLRREPVLREARAWFLRDFNPNTLVEAVTALRGERTWQPPL